MSLHPQVFCPIPAETARVARAAYPKGNVYLRIRDELGTVYKDESFAHLFPHCGQLAEAPWRLLLVCLMQFAEGLSDQQAAEPEEAKAPDPPKRRRKKTRDPVVENAEAEGKVLSSVKREASSEPINADDTTPPTKPKRTRRVGEPKPKRYAVGKPEEEHHV